jgi:hypothetical protein
MLHAWHQLGSSPHLSENTWITQLSYVHCYCFNRINTAKLYITVYMVAKGCHDSTSVHWEFMSLMYNVLTHTMSLCHWSVPVTSSNTSIPLVSVPFMSIWPLAITIFGYAHEGSPHKEYSNACKWAVSLPFLMHRLNLCPYLHNTCTIMSL